ncbi:MULTISPECIES: transcription repressor NadR [Oceanobacillus]|uniref:Transcriptional regulator n=1 Tax=Oceanobacillus indicireducens TaxID=1004261 RepID=A0A917XZR4_9BACI|nr:transcription repressor NadR [Oceanobacillus indicireducens]GGN61406.1 transcriptional regulator [Oceanobacillus indicireducens]
MQSKEKMSSSERQQLIINELKKSKEPITASKFAEKANVSRQVIVQDVSILKAKNEPVVATSQGYIYMGNQPEDNLVRKTIVVNHTPEQTLEELYIIVDHGVTVKDVSVDHPVYGDITASIRVSNRREVDLFYENLRGPNVAHLSSLTNGLHLHTLEADSMEKIEEVCWKLDEIGILVGTTN